MSNLILNLFWKEKSCPLVDYMVHTIVYSFQTQSVKLLINRMWKSNGGSCVSPKEQAFGVDKGCRPPHSFYRQHLKIYCEWARKLCKEAWRRSRFHFLCLLRKSQQGLVGKISQGDPILIERELKSATKHKVKGEGMELWRWIPW